MGDEEEFVEIPDGDEELGYGDEEEGFFEQASNEEEPQEKLAPPSPSPRVKEEEQLLAARPPTAGNDALKMLETFSNIHQATNELASMVNVVIKNSLDVITLGEKKVKDISEVIKQYESSYKKIVTSIQEAQEYFEANKHLAETFDKASDGLDDKFLKLQNELEIRQQDYIDKINRSTKKISDSLANIGDHINLEPLTNSINKQINDVMAKSGFNAFEKQLLRFENIFCGMNDVVIQLIGTKEKRGTLDDFDESLKTINNNLTKFNKKSTLMAATGFGAGGLFMGLFIGYFIFSSAFNEKLANSLIDGAVKQSKEISSNYEEVRKSAEAYEQFRKKYDLKDDSGFGYFDDTGKPYFFFDANRKTTRFKDKIYVGL